MKMLVNIDVSDLERAVTFYQAGLGLTHTRNIDDDVAELSGGSCILYLLERVDESPASLTAAGMRQYTRHWTPVHIDFVVEDIEEAVKRAILAGAMQESGFVEWMGSTCVTFSDPFGNGFCLITFTGETYSENACRSSTSDKAVSWNDGGVTHGTGRIGMRNQVQRATKAILIHGHYYVHI